jgi:hypothetical protein
MKITQLTYFLLFMLSSCYSYSYTISFDNTATTPSSVGVYAGTDYRIKITTDNYFISAEQLKICPWYCGATYSLYGIGLNHTYKIGVFELYADAGAYIVKSNSRYSNFNEYVYYYMVNRFGGGSESSTPAPAGFRVDTNNGYGAEFGARIPFADNYGMTLYYRHLQFFTNYVMYIQGGGYWHDPQTVKYNGFGFGLYYKF